MSFPHLTRDTWLLFATRFIRLFAYGSLSVVLVFYLIGVGLSEQQKTTEAGTRQGETKERRAGEGGAG